MRFGKSFASSVALITLFAVITRAIGFVFRIFLSRVLGPEMLGVYQIAMSFFMIFLTLVATGLPLAISKRVATKQSGGVVWAGLVIAGVLSLVACTVVLAGASLFGRLFTDARCIKILIVLVPSVIASGVYCVIRSVWWGEKRYFLLGLSELLEQVIRIVVFVIMLAFAFAFVDMGQIAAISYTVACVLGAAVVVAIFIKTYKLRAKSDITVRQQFKPLLRTAAPVTGVRTVASLTMPIICVLLPARLVAGGYTPTAAVAAFGVLVGMTLPVLTIPQTVISSLSTALVPELSSAHNDKDKVKINRQISNALTFTLFIVFALTPAFMALGGGMGTFLYANRTSGVLLSQFAFAMVPMSLSQITNAILNSLGAETRAMKHYFIGSIALFAAIWFLPPVMGVAALMVGMGACMTIASVLNLVLIARITGAPVVRTTLRQVAIFSALVVPTALIGYLLFGLLERPFGLFLALLVCGTACTGAYILLCHVLDVVKISIFRLKSSHNKTCSTS